MNLSILVARILAVMYVSAAVGMLTSHISYKKVYESFEASPGLTYVTGFLALIIGMILIHYHNFWGSDWRVMITLVGWVAMIKGITLIAFPQILPRFRSWFRNSSWLGFLMLLIGIIFGYFGFFM